jgi:hypothetical protein
MRTVILLAGPGKPAFGIKNVLSAEQALKNQGADLLRIGDGERDLTDTDVSDMLEAISKAKGDVTLVLMAHGNKAGELYLQGEHSKSTVKLFQDIANILKHRKIDIFSTACYGGLLQEVALQILPENSVYVSLSPANTVITGFNIDPFWDYLSKHKLSCLSAESMLVAYLLSSMKNRYLPTLATPKFTGDLDATLTRRCKTIFSIVDRGYIKSTLSVFLEDPRVLDTIMDKIETSRSSDNFGIAQYGLALAISYAASRNMTLDVNPIVEEVLPISEDKPEILSTSVLVSNSLFSSVERPKETYSSFKPGFLIGKSF